MRETRERIERRRKKQQQEKDRMKLIKRNVKGLAPCSSSILKIHFSMFAVVKFTLI